MVAPTSAPATPYVGRRIAAAPAPAAPLDLETLQTAVSTRIAAEAAATAALPVVTLPTEVTAAEVTAAEVTAELPLTRVKPAGQRKAVKHAGARGSLIKGLPSGPVLAGVATLAVAVGGALHSAGPDLASSGDTRAVQASALSGASGTGNVNLLERGSSVSRDSRRDALAAASDSDLVAAAEQQAQQRNAALAQFAKKAEAQADKIALNRWVAPLDYVSLTARFGEYGLWSSYHTGLDFNGNTGESIHAIANGVVTFAGYDGAYGNKTVVTLEDGTELWFCHQTEQFVSEGDVVRAGEVIGTVGTTGNVTGSHLHVEVRPGGGDPVDPYAAMEQHGVDLP